MSSRATARSGALPDWEGAAPPPSPARRAASELLLGANGRGSEDETGSCLHLAHTLAETPPVVSASHVTPAPGPPRNALRGARARRLLRSDPADAPRSKVVREGEPEQPSRGCSFWS